jgi:hypothetical protein
MALEGGREHFLRVLEEAQQPRLGDLATLSVLSERAADQAVTLAALGDRKSAETVLEDLRRIDPELAIVKGLTERLSKTRGRVDIAGLLP